MEYRGEKSKNRLSILWVVTVILALVSGGLIFTSYRLLQENTASRELDHSTYQYHIAIISDDTDNSFWEEIYAGAKAAGEGYGAYVEQIDDGLVNQFSMEDALNVAIYAGVDGILLRPTEGEISQEIIEKAYEYGIPIITIQKDLLTSKRQGFVGINDYFLGQEYGKQVLKLAEEDTSLVMVLVPGATFDETSQSWFQQGLVSTVEQDDIQSDFQIIQDDMGLNNAEDIIHAIAEGEVEQPDIILCLDETITLSTSQLVRESGLSDRVTIIGSYVSDAILQEISAGYLDSTITVDPQAMGQMGIDALMTYINYNMVSYYTEVGTMLIDQDVVASHGEEVDVDEASAD